MNLAALSDCAGRYRTRGVSAASSISDAYISERDKSEREAKQRRNGMTASYSRMKWQQGLAVITRAEHWDLASQHLWGLSGSDIAAYLHSSPPDSLHPIDDFRKTRAFSRERAQAATATTSAT
jgi:hypothetical protein